MLRACGALATSSSVSGGFKDICPKSKLSFEFSDSESEASISGGTDADGVRPGTTLASAGLGIFDCPLKRAVSQSSQPPLNPDVPPQAHVRWARPLAGIV